MKEDFSNRNENRPTEVGDTIPTKVGDTRPTEVGGTGRLKSAIRKKPGH